MVTINPVSGLPRKKRKTSPIPRKRRSKFQSEQMKKLWRNKRFRKKMVAKFREAAKYRKPGGRIGVPDGMRKAQALVLWDRAREQAKEFIRIMEQKGDLPEVVIPGSEEEMAKRALEEAFVMAIGPLTDVKSKAQYLRMVLDFTKSKPESKNKLTLENSAEWLAALAADMPKKDANGGAE